MWARPGRLRISVSQAFQLRPEPLPGSGESLADELDHAAMVLGDERFQDLLAQFSQTPKRPRLGHLIEYIGALVHPAALFAGPTVDLTQRFPETKRAVADGQFRTGGTYNYIRNNTISSNTVSKFTNN